MESGVELLYDHSPAEIIEISSERRNRKRETGGFKESVAFIKLQGKQNTL